MGAFFPATRNGREDDGLGAGMDDPFFLKIGTACSFCKASFSSGNNSCEGLPRCPLRLTGFLKSLLRQLLDGCQLVLVPVDRQLSWCCNIKLDEICWSFSECDFKWCYTRVGDGLISDRCSCLHQGAVPALMELSMILSCAFRSRTAAAARFGHGAFGPGLRRPCSEQCCCSIQNDKNNDVFPSSKKT